MIRLVLMLALLVGVIVAFRRWGRGSGRSRREALIRELRGAFLHSSRPDQQHRSDALSQHSWGELIFRLPKTWSAQQQGDVLVFRVGALGDAALQVLQRGEGPVEPASSSCELLPDGTALVRWLSEAESAERVQYGWRLRSANEEHVVTLLLELTLAEASEAFHQADATTIDRAVREARFERPAESPAERAD